MSTHPDPQTPDMRVVLPTLNERGSLPRVIEEIHRALQRVSHEVIVVDDDSTDGTPEWVEQATVQDSGLHLVRRRAEPDLSQAVIEGFRTAHAGHFIVMDAEG